jgi:phage terminase large subunit-like protein
VNRHRELLWLLSRAPDEVKAAVWSELSPSDVRAIAWDWSTHALKRQREPEGDWRVWLLLAGRGFGKTRIGAEWVLKQARNCPDARIALIGATIDEVARIMVEGDSGILRCAPPDEAPDWLVSRHELRFRSGAIAHAYSGGNGDGLRGPQHHFAWADELGKWSDAESAWDNLAMGMRLGPRPRVLVTTTPGNSALLKRIMAEPGVELRRGRTADNVHLPRAFIEAMEAAYRGSRLGRQELDGVIVDEAQGALWTRPLLEKCRTKVSTEDLRRVVVGVDPPASSTGDACGILVCGLTSDGRGLVLADASVSGQGPSGWARRVASAAEAWQADRVVAEVNNGGDMVESVLRQVEPALPVRKVRASRGKVARAEPVATMFEVGTCGLAGFFPELEDELSAFTAAGYLGSGSPDRADAMVWALTELSETRSGVPRVRRL